MNAPPVLIRQILTASGLFFVAQIVAKLLNFVFFVLLARWLSVEHFGLLAYAVAVSLIVDVIADMGMTRLLLRDVSRRPAIAARRLALFLPLKATLGITLYALAVAFVIGSHPEDPATAVFVIIGFTVPFTGATLLSEQILHGRGLFGFAAAAHLTLALTQLGGAAAAHALGGGTEAIAVMVVVGNVAYLAVILTGLHRCGVRLRLRWRPKIWPDVLRQSAPFAAVGILILLALKIEFFVLGYLADATALGRFGGASRIFDAAIMAPLTLCAVLAPRFIEQQGRSVGELTTLYGQGVRILLSVAVLIALLGIGLAPDVVRLLLPPDYAAAADVLRLMFFGFPGLALYLLNVALMLGARNQLRPALLLLMLVGVQTATAFVLIGRSADLGAAEAMVMSSTIAAVMSSVMVRVWLLGSFILTRAALPVLAGLVCSLVVWATTGAFDDALRSVFAAAVFAAATAVAMNWMPISSLASSSESRL